MRKWMIVLAVFTAALTIGSKNTNAQTAVELSTGGVNVFFTSLSNTITVLSGTDGGWSVTLVEGVSNSPNLNPQFGIQVTSILVTCVAAPCQSNPLSILLSGTNFTQTVSSTGFFTTYTLLSQSPTGTGSTTQSARYDITNTSLGTGTSIGTVTGVLGISKTTTGGGPAGPSPYSLTIDDTFTGSVGTSFTVEGDIGATTPEPGSMLLFGSGLLVVGGILRRRLLHA